MDMAIGIAWFAFMAVSMVFGTMDDDKGGMLMGGAG
tara:strand:+ start:8120 stop:8227 length:108 start_codon:yes stop_codon:yes gene_type:complete